MGYETTSAKGAGPLQCEEWEALLADALDGTLAADDTAAFAAHKDACLACAQLLEEAQRGSEWLGYLKTEPEIPEDLLTKILARTSGTSGLAAAGVPLGAGTAPAIAQEQAWMGRSFAMLHRHAVESRLLMTAAMAFFSIAFTLNLVGIRLDQMRLSDLKPGTLATQVSRQYYTASAHVVRYYENLRFVYEVESRVNEFRRDTENSGAGNSGSGGDSSSPATAPRSRSPQKGGDAAQPPADHPSADQKATPPKSAPQSERHDRQPGTWSTPAASGHTPGPPAASIPVAYCAVTRTHALQLAHRQLTPFRAQRKNRRDRGERSLA